MNSNSQVYIAMSGGVDSAVAASRLLFQGFQVTGIHMETWIDPKWESGNQQKEHAIELAKKTADSLGIMFVSLDLRQQFYKSVVQSFIKQYVSGMTPNPCLFCNPQVKWGILQTVAFEQGADYFATGHYASLIKNDSNRVRLMKAKDASKDQSYVLSMLRQEQLKRTLLPLGDMLKSDVRAEAKRLGLPTAEREDSQDLCFLGSINYRDFLRRYAPDSISPGEIVDMDGKVIGEHQGLAFYTIGQRKGIRVASSEPYYVVGKNLETNRLVVGYEHQAGQRTLVANQMNWISGYPPVANEIYDVMIRYRTKPVPALLSDVSSGQFRLEFIKPQRGITPGQVAVLYQGGECLGGGTIQNYA